MNRGVAGRKAWPLISGPSRHLGWGLLGLLGTAWVGAMSWAAGYAATLEVSTFKLAGVVLAFSLLPVALINLEFGTLAFLAVLWGRVSDIAITFHGAPSTALPLGGLLMMTALIKSFTRGQNICKESLRHLLPIMPYVTIALLSALWSFFPNHAIASGIAILKDVLIFWLLSYVLRGPGSLTAVALTLVVTSSTLSLIDLHQYITSNFSSQYAGFAQSDMRHIIGETELERLGGPVGDPNYFAVILVVVVPLGLGLLRTHLRPIERCAIAGLVLAMVLAILLTYSRGGAFLLGLALLLSARRHRVRLPHVLMFSGALLLIVLIAPSAVWSRIGTVLDPLTERRDVGRIVDSSTELRLGAQQAAIEMFLERPFAGVGAGNFPALYQQVTTDLGLRAVRGEFQPHNVYLEILAETGLLGLAAYAFMVLAALGSLRKARSRLRGSSPEVGDRCELMYGIEAAFLVYLTSGLLLQASYPRYFWMLLALVVAAGSAARLEPEGPRAPLGERAAPPQRGEGLLR